MMSPVKLTKKTLTNSLSARAERFAREEDGIMTVWVLAMIMMMVMVGGIQLDFMRHQMERSRLQAVSDRAALAAADLDQTQDPKTVVQDYFTKSGMSSYLSSVTVDPGLNYRTVTVDASKELDTPYLRKFGVDTLTVPARSKAEERFQKVEISLVLDVSGSMADNSKLSNMKVAAKSFIDTVMRPGTEGYVSLSLVPYSEQVNVGPNIFNALWVDTFHNFSHCIDVPDGHFVQTQMTPGFPWDQTQHFQWNRYSIETDYEENTLFDTVCPRQVYERVLPISQNADALKDQIDLFQARAGTAIYMGVKWGTALLDGSFQQSTTKLVSDGVVEATFADRPAPYNDAETLKTIVLMTDGENSDSNRISSSAYKTDSEIAHWSNWNFQYYLHTFISSKKHHQYYYPRYTAATGDTLLENICDAAKREGIVIWSIGFEVDLHGTDIMKNCASSPSHYFDVDGGTELTDAFKAIAGQIHQLRLIQ